MTLLTVTQFGPATFNLFSPVEGLLLGTEQTSSSTSATLLIPSSSGVATYDITGSGLVFSGGLLVAGIVTSITYKVDGVTRVVGSGFTLDVADARNHPQGTYPIAIDPIWNYDASALPPDANGAGITFVAADGSDTAVGTAGADSLSGVGGNDVLFAGAGNDTLDGGLGDDLLRGGAGKDKIDGNAGGSDLADYSDKTERIEVQLDGATQVRVKVNGKTEDKIKNVEGIAGGSAADEIIGDGKSNILLGGGGNDTLLGGGGKDLLFGGDGKDTVEGGGGKDILEVSGGKDVLEGGASRDQFVFGASSFSGADKILDFEHNRDKLVLNDSVFTAIGANLDAGELRLGKSAKDADDFILYHGKTGKLYYDADGSGAVGKVHIATLTNKAVIDGDDFLIV